MRYGQLIVGPPGSGKSTYARQMKHLYTSVLHRPTILVNLDVSSEDRVRDETRDDDTLGGSDVDIDIRVLVEADRCAEEFGLGPNGAILYAVSYVAENVDWLLDAIDRCAPHGGTYFLFDCPGQVELYTHTDSFPRIIRALENAGIRLCCVSLADAHYCADPAKFISVILVSLASMLHLSLPHVNVLSKVDIISQYGELDFHLEEYAELEDLDGLMDAVDRRLMVAHRGLRGDSTHVVSSSDENGSGEWNQLPAKWKQFRRLTRKLLDIIGDFSLVSFTPINSFNQQHLARLTKIIDKSNGYLLSTMESDSVYIGSILDDNPDFLMDLNFENVKWSEEDSLIDRNESASADYSISVTPGISFSGEVIEHYESS